MTAFKIGADPELFLVTKDGRNISAHDRIPGDKRNPHKVNAGAIQPDGLAAEFNIDAVDYNNFSAFDKNLTTVIGELKKVVGDDVSFSKSASVVFDKEYYEALPAAAKELGCDPDYCAYSDDPFQPNPRPDGTSGLRSGAGHIHVGWDQDIPVDHPDHMEICRSFIKQLDCYVGLGMTIFDTDTERRKLYGKAGAFRPKSYGVEYRTPSNAWVTSRARRQFVHNLVVQAINNMQSASPTYLKMNDKGFIKKYGNVVDIINNGDSKAAINIFNNWLGIYIPAAILPEAKAAA